MRPGGGQLTRVAAVDCGTNSIRLLIADVNRDELVDVHRELRIVRLGQGVDGSGRLVPEAIARTETALQDYADLVRHHRADAVRMVATSATRDAANRNEFAAMVSLCFNIGADPATGFPSSTVLRYSMRWSPSATGSRTMTPRVALRRRSC